MAVPQHVFRNWWDFLLQFKGIKISLQCAGTWKSAKHVGQTEWIFLPLSIFLEIRAKQHWFLSTRRSGYWQMTLYGLSTIPIEKTETVNSNSLIQMKIFSTLFLKQSGKIISLNSWQNSKTLAELHTVLSCKLARVLRSAELRITSFFFIITSPRLLINNSDS